MTGQSKLMSWTETLLNTAFGYVVALIAQLAIFPMFDVHVSLAKNIGIGAMFMGVSVIRGYATRRFFNWVHVSQIPEPTHD